MSFLTKAQFKSLLSQIRATGAALDRLVFTASSYCAEQSCAHGNHSAWDELLAVVPVYAQKPVKAAQREAKKTWKSMSPAQRLEYHATAEPIAQAVAEELEARREARKANVAARKATPAKAAKQAPAKAPKVPKAEPAAKPEPAHGGAVLVSPDGHEQQITAEEYAALAAYLTEIRTQGKVKVA